jgi:co-chaperonin GroES (HSP10)
VAHAIEMVHDEHPRDTIWAEVRPHLDDVRVLGARVLVAVYVRPEKTKSGLFLTSKSVEEDKYQGKVGMVLALGPIAFQDDASHRFGSVTPQVGDWVVYNVGDTFAMEIGERRCRAVEDVDIAMIIQHPDGVW